MQDSNTQSEREKALAVLNTKADECETRLTNLAYKLASYKRRSLNWIITKHKMHRTHVHYLRIVKAIEALERND